MPVLSLVFVQSHDGNTEADDPASLGGGETDKHVIYEGLSRVSADAVLAGAKTVGDGNVVFSVWHPEIVSLRASLGKPRHPIQIVASLSGSMPIEEGLLFNVPEVRVIILTGEDAAARLASRTRERPWIGVITLHDPGELRAALARLRRDFGVRRISAVGGRTVATRLIDEKLVSDLYLTTSPIEGGTPGTPMYSGGALPPCNLVLRKQDDDGVIFEHLRLTTDNHEDHQDHKDRTQKS